MARRDEDRPGVIRPVDGAARSTESVARSNGPVTIGECLNEWITELLAAPPESMPDDVRKRFEAMIGGAQ